MISKYEKLKQKRSIPKTIDSDKYKLLYEYMKDRYLEEMQKYKALEEKSLKYLTSISFAIASFVLLLRWSLPQINDRSTPYIDCFILFFILTTLILFSLSWFNIFRSIQLQEIERMNSKVETIDFFKKYKIDEINSALSKKYSEIIDKNRKQYEKKLSYVKYGYEYILYSAISFLLFVSILMIKFIII